MQVTSCINKVCRRMGGLRDLSSGKQRAKLPLLYIPQVLDAVSDALSMAANAKAAGFTVKVCKTSKSRRNAPESSDVAAATDNNNVLGDAEDACGMDDRPASSSSSSQSSSVSGSNNKRPCWSAAYEATTHMDRGSLW